MRFSYNWLQSFFDKKLPEPKELARLIIGHSFEVEAMEKSDKDTVFDIAILSNRPDCFSHAGIAREVAAILGYKLNLPKVKAAKTKTQTAAKSMVEVQVADAAGCPRYSAKVVAGLKVGPSPKWMQERLAACGLRAINNIVDATNYVMLETGQPLHAFDWDKLAAGRGKAKKIIVRYAADGEVIEALGDKKYQLTPAMLLITDEAGPLAIAGIKGGKRAEISQETTTIVLESANFNPRSVRLTSRGLGLVTDASVRFAHDMDRGQTLEVVERVADLVAQISGGQVAAGVVDRNPNPAKPKKLVLGMEKAESLLGAQIQTARAKKILELLGFAVRKGNKADLEVTVPTRRTDVTISEDLMEEIGRIDGYEKVAAVVTNGPVLPPAVNYFWLWKTILRDAMIACGWSETRNYTFVSEVDCKKFGYATKDLLEIKNPVNADFAFMRPGLLINLAKNILKNPGRDDLDQFEIGKIFGSGKRNEPTMLAGISKRRTFFEVKGTIEFALRRLGIENCVFELAGVEKVMAGDVYNLARTARLVVGKKAVGYLGQLSDEAAAAAGIKPAIIFELSVDELARMATRKNDYKPISTHPAAIRDLAVLVPREALAQNIINEIVKSAGILAVSVEPIDIYEGSEIPQGSKNIAFRINYQAKDRTLGGEEIDALQAKVTAAVEARGWQVRK